MLMPGLLAGWFITTMMPLILLDYRAAKAELACLRRWFGGGEKV